MSYVRARVNMLDTWIDNIDMAGTLERVDDFIRSGLPHQIVTVNLDFLRLSVQDRSFQNLINTANLVIADGMPLVWGAHLQGHPLPERVTGVDLVGQCARLAVERGYRMLFLGAGPGIAERAAEVLRERYPGLDVAVGRAPSALPMAPEDEDTVLDMIRAHAPHMLFVAFGAPFQERWVREHMDELGIPICAGVGGAFDMISGRVPRAPGWMQRNGLEWFYRFAREPRRLWKRYFVRDLPMFVRLIVHSSTRATTVSVTEIGTSDLAAVLPQAGSLPAHE